MSSTELFKITKSLHNVLDSIRDVKSKEDELLVNEIASNKNYYLQLVDALKYVKSKLSSEEDYIQELFSSAKVLLEMKEYTTCLDLFLQPALEALKLKSYDQSLSLEVQIRQTIAECRLRKALIADKKMLFPSTLNECTAILDIIQESIQLITSKPVDIQEKLYWLVFNGSILVIEIGETMIEKGFASKVVNYIIYSLLSSDLIINLSTAKFIPWKMRHYSLISRCYEEVNDYPACRKALEKAFITVKTLRDLESRDPPIPTDVVKILDKADRDSSILLFKVDVLLKKEIPSTVMTKFTSDSYRAIALSETLFSSLRRTIKQDAIPELLAGVLPAVLEQVNKVIVPHIILIVKEIEDTFSAMKEKEEDGGEMLLSTPVPQSLRDKVNIIPLKLHLNLLKCSFDYKLWDLFRVCLSSFEKRMKYRKEMKSTNTILDEEFICIVQQVDLLRAVFILKYPVEYAISINVTNNTPPLVVEVENVSSRSSASKSSSAIESARNKESARSGAASSRSDAKSLEAPQTVTTEVVVEQKTNLESVSALSKLLNKVCLGECDLLIKCHPDLVVDSVKLLWDPFLVAEIDNYDQQTVKDMVNDKSAHFLVENLNIIHNLAFFVEFQDPEMLATVSLRLALILETLKRKKQSIQIFSSSLRSLCRSRAAILSHDTHNVTSKQAVRASSRVSIAVKAIDDEIKDGEVLPLRILNMNNINKSLAALHADLLFNLFRVELDVSIEYVLSTKKKSGKKNEEVIDSQITTIPITESKLIGFCKQNEWALALLSICFARLRARHPDKDIAEADRDKYLKEGLKYLEESIRSEVELLQSMDENKVQKKHNDLVLPPVIVSRTDHTITLKLQLEDNEKEKTVMLFGKTEGNGTDVSLNNADYPGLGIPILIEKGKESIITVNSLVPNEKYIFAASLCDESTKRPSVLAKQSLPIGASFPLIPMQISGYIMNISMELKATAVARDAARLIYNYFVNQKDINSVSLFNNVSLCREKIARASNHVLRSLYNALHILLEKQHDENTLAISNNNEEILYDNEKKLILPSQVKALNNAHKMSMASEVGIALNDYALISDAVTVAYNSIVPLLAMRNPGAVLFQSVVLCYNALQAVPLSHRDFQIEQINSCLFYQLSRFCSNLNCPLKIENFPYLNNPLLQSKETNSLKRFILEKSGNFVNTVPKVDNDEALLSPEKKELLALMAKTPLECFQQLQEKFKNDDIYLEYCCKCLTIAIQTGKMDAATFISENIHFGNINQQCENIWKEAMRFDFNKSRIVNESESTQTEQEKADDYNIAQLNLNSPSLSSQDLNCITQLCEIEKLRGQLIYEQLINEGKYTSEGNLGPFTDISHEIKISNEERKVNRLLSLETDKISFETIIEVVPEAPVDILPATSSRSTTSSKPPSTPLPTTPLIPAPVLIPPLTTLQLLNICSNHFSRAAHLATVCNYWHKLQNISYMAFNAASYAWCSPIVGSLEIVKEIEIDEDLILPKNLLGENEGTDGEGKVESVAPILSEESVQTTVTTGGEGAPIKETSSLNISLKQSRDVPFYQKWLRISMCLLKLLEEPGNLSLNNANSFSLTNRSTSFNKLSVSERIMMNEALNTLREIKKVDEIHISNVIFFTIQLLHAAERYKEIVSLGLRYNKITNNVYGERLLPFMIHAQEQLSNASEAVYKEKFEEIEAAKAVREEERALSRKKKKRKTQQLVAEEEVITPREAAFRQTFQVLQNQLNFFENIMNSRFELLNEMKNVLSCMDRDKLNTLDAIESSRKLSITYIRQMKGALMANLGNSLSIPPSLLRMGSVNGGLSGNNVSLSSLIGSYEKTIKLLRSKQSSFLLPQALKELGNIYFSSGKGIDMACKSWTDCVDAVMGCMDSILQWRSIFESQKSLLASYSLRNCLIGGIVLAQLAQHVYVSDLYTRSEHIYMASRLLAVPLESSLNHCRKYSDLAGYKAEELWPGIDLFSDTKIINPAELMLALEFVCQELIKLESYDETFPLLIIMEYIATKCIKCTKSTVNARLIRAETLVSAGYLTESSKVLIELYEGSNLPISNSLSSLISIDNSISAPQHQEEVEAPVKGKGGKNAPAAAASVKNVVEIILTPYLSHFPAGANENINAINWLKDISALKLKTKLVDLYGKKYSYRLLIARAHIILQIAKGTTNKYGVASSGSANSNMRDVLFDSIENLSKHVRELINDDLTPPPLPPTQQVSTTTASGRLGTPVVEIPPSKPRSLTMAEFKILTECSFLEFEVFQSRGLLQKAEAVIVKLMQDILNIGGEVCKDEHSNQEVDFLVWIKARVVLSKLQLQQGRFDSAKSLIKEGMKEAIFMKEKIISRELIIVEIYLMVVNGEIEIAIQLLKEKMEEKEIYERGDVCQIKMMYLLGYLSNAMARKNWKNSESNSNFLKEATEYFSRASSISLIRANNLGWVGFESGTTSILTNFYNEYVMITAFCKLYESISFCQLSDYGNNQDSNRDAQKCANDGLKALLHVSNPPLDVQSRLLLISGRLQRIQLPKLLSENNNMSNNSSPLCFTEAHDMLKKVLTINLKGFHDHNLMYEAAMELSLLFGSKLIKGLEEQHKQTACHYLRLAALLKKQGLKLTNSINDITSAPLTALDKLPLNIKLDILEASKNKESQGGIVIKSENELTAYHLIRFRNSVYKEFKLPLRSLHAEYLCEVLTKTHTFLSENYPLYNTNCTVKEPFVPSVLDPKLPVDTVIIQWYKVDSTMSSSNQVMMVYIVGGDVPVLNNLLLNFEGVEKIKKLFGNLRIKIQALMREGKQEAEASGEFKECLETTKNLVKTNVVGGGNGIITSLVDKGLVCNLNNVRIMEQIWNTDLGTDCQHLEINSWLKVALM